nr:MAG TPA: hypothetical protein [Caudoviricetes sp.]
MSATPSSRSLATSRSRGPRQSFWNQAVRPNHFTSVGLTA